MNILFLISSEGYYGAENMLITLARSLSRLGCRCVIGVFRNSRFPHTEVGEQAQREGFAVEVVPCMGRWDRRAVAHVRKLIVKHDVEVLHTHGYKADMYAYAAAWPNRVPLLATIHNWPCKQLSMRAYAALDRLLLRKFDRVAVISDPVENILLRSGVAPERVCNISNGVDIERFQQSPPTLRTEIGREGHSLVGFVGRLVPDKGGEFLLRAAHQVVAAHPKTTFVLVGEGPSRAEWGALASSLGISEHVVFAGERQDMPGVYASLDLVVLPSLIEAMPMCLLEAMASAKPVIATPIGAIPRLVIAEQTGLLVEPRDANGLATAILRLLKDPELSCRLGRSGYAHVKQGFSAEAMAKSYVGLYEQLLVRRRNRTPGQAGCEMSCG